MGQIITNKPIAVRCNLQAIQTGGSKATVVLADGEVWLVDTANSNKGVDGYGKYDGYIVGNGVTAASSLIVKKIDDIPDEDELKDFVSVKYKTTPPTVPNRADVGDYWIYDNNLNVCTKASEYDGQGWTTPEWETVTPSANKLYIYNNIIFRYLTDSFVQVGEQGPQGEKGDTGDTGPQGPQGIQGNTGISVGDNWEAFSALEALDGKTIAEKEAMLPDGNAVQSIVDITGIVESYTEIDEEDGSVVSGYSLGADALIKQSGRSYWRFNLYDYKKRLRRARIKAGSNGSAGIAFIRTFDATADTTIYYADSQTHSISTGSTEEIDVPVNTLIILINRYSTANVFPSMIEFLFEDIEGGSLAENSRMEANKYSHIVDIEDAVFYNRSIVFNAKDVSVGDRLSISMTLNLPEGSDGKYYVGWLGCYDSSGNRIDAFGKTLNNEEDDSPYTGTYVVTHDFAYAQLVATAPGGVNITIQSTGKKNIGETGSLGEYTEVDITTYPTATNCYLSQTITGLLWNTSSVHNGRVWRIIDIPEGARYIKVLGKYDVRPIFLQSWTTPSNNLLPDFALPETLLSGPSLLRGEFVIPKGASYVIFMTHSTTIDVGPEYVGFASARPSVVSAVMEMDDVIQGRQIENMSCPVEADVVLSTADSGATQYDNLNIGYFNVLKISEEMYYMYYSCVGMNDYPSANDGAQHLALAYSTDSVNWTRGIPSGITPPVSGTNLVFQNKVVGAQVFKVMDNEYPYRMLASYRTASNPDTRLYKSADGVNFSLVRVVFDYYMDNQVSCIVKGNIVKVYCRWRSDVDGVSTSANTHRWLGVFTMDIDGNVILPPTTFGGRFFYQASAAVLDDRREVMFPTVYNSETDTQWIHCYIVEGRNMTRIPLDTSSMIESDEKSYYVAPGLINVGNDMYLYMSCRTTSHNAFSTSNVTRVKRVKVEFDVEGRPYILPT